MCLHGPIILHLIIWYIIIFDLISYIKKNLICLFVRLFSHLVSQNSAQQSSKNSLWRHGIYEQQTEKHTKKWLGPHFFLQKKKKYRKKLNSFRKKICRKCLQHAVLNLTYTCIICHIHVHTVCTWTRLHKSYVKLQLEKKKFYSEQSFIFIELNVFWGYFYQKWVRKSRMSGILFFFFLVAFHHYKIQQIHVVAKEKIV